MSRGIYDAASAMAASERRVEAITSNLANAGAVGFKRRGVVTHSFQHALDRRLQPQLATVESTDFSQGVLRPTGDTYDLALEGPGFFVVDTAQGEAFTRGGAFHVDQNGVLQTRDGVPVAWDGSRGRIDPVGVQPVVDARGNVRQGAVEVGRLKLVDFANPSRLGLDRQGYLRAKTDMSPEPAAGAVRQGALENANVNAIDELVGLIAAQRAFESSARTLSAIEQVLRRVTNPR